MDTALNNAREMFPPMWVIYANPRDHWREGDAAVFVVRVWYGKVCEQRAFKCSDLGDARMWAIKHGASYCLGREAADDPVIVESWV